MRDLSIFLIFFAVFYSTNGQTTVQSLCNLPMDEGTGSDVRIYLYYNKDTDNCQPFRYSGEGGNANRFIAEVQCMRNCSARANSLYPLDRSKACHLPRASGECLGYYLRYYYDPAHGKCKTFFWTGCVGNGNRFFTIQSCNNTCSGIIDEAEGKEEEVESDSPVGIILGVVLGIIGAIILIVVIVLMLKNKSTPQNSKAKAKKDKGSSGPDTPLQNDKIEMA